MYSWRVVHFIILIVFIEDVHSAYSIYILFSMSVLYSVEYRWAIWRGTSFKKHKEELESKVPPLKPPIPIISAIHIAKTFLLVLADLCQGKKQSKIHSWGKLLSVMKCWCYEPTLHLASSIDSTLFLSVVFFGLLAWIYLQNYRQTSTRVLDQE